jgi:hypothetical protein
LIFQLRRLKSAGLQLHPRLKIRLSVNSLMAERVSSRLSRPL